MPSAQARREGWRAIGLQEVQQRGYQGRQLTVASSLRLSKLSQWCIMCSTCPYKAPAMTPPNRLNDHGQGILSGPSHSTDCARTIMVPLTLALWKNLQSIALCSRHCWGARPQVSRAVVVARGNILAFKQECMETRISGYDYCIIRTLRSQKCIPKRWNTTPEFWLVSRHMWWKEKKQLSYILTL